MNSKKNLNKKLHSEQIMRIVGAHNAIGSYLIEKNGFDAVWASGFEISASYGVPDADLIGLSELANEVNKIVQGTKLPVFVDCDTGFGDIAGVKRTVETFEKIGAAGICIEDKVYPKTNSYIEGRQKLISIKDFQNKISVAKMAKKDSDFIIIARIESLICGAGIDDAVRRAKCYKEAGADAILIHSKSHYSNEVLEFSSIWNEQLPLFIVPTTYPDLTVDQMRKSKISATIFANHGLRSSVKAMDKVLRTLSEEGNLRSIEKDCASMQEIFEIQKMDEMIKLENSFKEK